MGAVWTWDRVGRNTRDCMISLIPLGFCAVGLGIAANVILPVCYQIWSKVMTLGVLYMTAGSISIASANAGKKTNYFSRISVSMMLHVMSWIETIHIVAIAINLMTKSFFRDMTIPRTQCPWSGDSAENERLYYILGGVTLGVLVACLVLSVICFRAFWKSPEWFYEPTEPTTVGSSGIHLNPVRQGLPRRENVYTTPQFAGGTDVARAIWPTPPGSPSYTASKRGLPLEQDYTQRAMYNSSGQLGGGKALRIVSADRHIRKTCVVASMREMLLVAKEKLRFNGDENVGLCYDASGEDIEDEAAFQAVPDYSRLMVFSKSLHEEWEPPKYPFVGGLENGGYAQEALDYRLRPGRRTIYHL